MDYWVAEKVKKCLDDYASTNTFGKYPWASKLDSDDYNDDSDEQFGRIPLTLLNSAKLYNDLLNQWPPECFDETAGLDNGKWGWWNEWKKMVFFAVDDEYCPTCSLTPVSPTMTLSGDAMKMIVLVAGRRLMEERDETKRADYLEGDNHYGNEEFEFKDHATPTFNDVVLGTP
jgi:hypothetical protein